MKRPLAITLATVLASLATFSASPALASSPLCVVSSNLDNDYEWLTSISVSSVSFEPVLDSSPYQDATVGGHTLGPISVEPGHSYSVSLGVEAARDDGNGNTWVEDAALWIDFNANGRLEPTEKVFLGGSDTGSWTPIDSSDPASDVSNVFTGTFTVPTSAASGILRVRAMNFAHDNTSAVPCPSGSTIVSGSAVDFELATPATLSNTGSDSRPAIAAFVLLGMGILLMMRRRSADVLARGLKFLRGRSSIR